MAEPLNLVGQRFGRLLVTEYLGIARTRSGHTYSQFKCLCDCGNETVKPGKGLHSGKINSCGCLRIEVTRKRATHHGLSNTKLYDVWQSMRKRCNNPADPAYHNYGARGIGYDKSWDDYIVFYKWACETGYIPDAGLTLERIDVNKGYCPENCCWVDMKAQSNNKRNNRRYTMDGTTHTLTEWCEIYNVPFSRVSARIDDLGWSFEDALKKEKAIQEYEITYKGITNNTKWWSKITGLSTQTLRNRKKKGWSDVDCIEIPLLRKGEKKEWVKRRTNLL